MGNHVPFIVPVVNVTTLKTVIRLRTIGSRHTQVRRKRKRLVVHLAKTAFTERITDKLLPAFCQKTPLITCLLNGEVYGPIRAATPADVYLPA